MSAMFHRALKYFNEQDYSSAQEIISDILIKNEDDTDALYFLAIVKSKLGLYDEAVSLFKKLLENEKNLNFESKRTEALYNTALCLQNLNRNEEALLYYKKVLEKNPFLSEAHNNMAVIYRSLNRIDDAEKAYLQAVKVKPENANAYANLKALRKVKLKSKDYTKAVQLFEEKKYEDAKKIFHELLHKNKNDIDLLFSLGLVYFSTNEYEKSKSYYERILELENDNAVAVYSIGVCWQNLENKEAALKYYERAIELNPKYTDALNNYALLNSELKRYDVAEEYYKRAIECDPSYFIAISNLGVLKLNQDNFTGAMDLFIKAEGVAKNSSDNEKKSIAFCNIGHTYQKQNRITEALEYFTKAVELDPTNMLAHYNLAEIYFIMGNLPDGWKEYEWRTGRKDFGKRQFSQPIPKNADLTGKKVLVYAEQGLGDAIQFIRYIPMLKGKGCFIIFECEKSLFGLLNKCNFIDQLIERNIDKAPDVDYDYEIPLLSLPLFFGTDLNSIPDGVGLLSISSDIKNKWNQIIGSSDKYKIGIVWAGSPIHSNDRHRSVRLSNFLNLLSIEGTQFFSLQKGFPVIQAKDYHLLLTILDEKINSFADTAAAIENLDLVITVDTSVAHLAGALGKPVWVLIPFHPDWRWMLDREDSPWYPTMKLFRQPKFMDWSSPFNEIKKELQKLVDEKKKNRNEYSVTPLRESDRSLYLGLTSGENFGWGICSKYLRKELSSKINIINIEEFPDLINANIIGGKIFHALINHNFESLVQVRGIENFGYTFFEFELTDKSVENAKKYNLVIGGSSWNRDKMQEKGITNSDVLIQGIDPELFYPDENPLTNNEDLFVIFSGGKFELRKGQDLILRAIKVLQQKYPNVILINAWYNMWPNTMQAMSHSPHIKYEYKDGTWKNFMINLCLINGIDGNKVFTLPLTPNNKMREVYLKTDVGLFPNRCEGGTNLVMMEYMACGKPVIGSFNTGHKDILTPLNSIPLKTMKEFKLFSDDKNLIADWQEPDFDEIIASLEYAYQHRNEIKQLGHNAGNYMKKFTWTAMADNLLKLINS